MKVIESFCYFAFHAVLTSGVIIECEYDTVSMVFRSRYFYRCEGSIVTVENPTTVINVSGIHLEGKNNTDVRNLNVKNNKILTKIPQGVENFGNISTIVSSTFQPFPELLQIHLSYNKIVALDGDLFQYTRMLR